MKIFNYNYELEQDKRSASFDRTHPFRLRYHHKTIDHQEMVTSYDNGFIFTANISIREFAWSIPRFHEELREWKWLDHD